MLEILQFIFSSFWVWLGTLAILEVCGNRFRNSLMFLRAWWLE
jgi:hypothetical protein